MLNGKPELYIPVSLVFHQGYDLWKCQKHLHVLKTTRSSVVLHNGCVGIITIGITVLPLLSIQKCIVSPSKMIIPPVRERIRYLAKPVDPEPSLCWYQGVDRNLEDEAKNILLCVNSLSGAVFCCNICL